MGIENGIIKGPPIVYAPPTDRNQNGHKDPRQQNFDSLDEDTVQGQLGDLYNNRKRKKTPTGSSPENKLRQLLHGQAGKKVSREEAQSIFYRTNPDDL